MLHVTIVTQNQKYCLFFKTNSIPNLSKFRENRDCSQQRDRSPHAYEC